MLLKETEKNFLHSLHKKSTAQNEYCMSKDSLVLILQGQIDSYH